MMSDFGEQVDENPLAAKGFVLSAMFMGAIVLVGTLVIGTIFFGGSPDEDEGDPPASSETQEDGPAAEPRRRGGEESVCGLTEVDLSGTLQEPPPNIEWVLVGRIAAPSSEGHGPGSVEDDGYRSCYARTPLGAVLAVSNWTAMGSDAELSEGLPERLLAQGPGRDAALRNPDPPASDDNDTSIQIAGFRLVSYDGEEASVQLAFTSSMGLNLVFTIDARWEDGDWKQVLADDGAAITPPYPLESITGFVRWYGA